jgi:hypothetical protein
MSDSRAPAGQNAARPVPAMASLLAAWTVVLLAGCAQPAVRSDDALKFGRGVSQTRQQARIAFHDANALAREQAIQYVLATTRPGITEQDFTPALDPQVVAAWDTAFGLMESYASSLQQLLAPERPAGFGNAVVELGSELKSGRVGTTVPPTVGTAFAQLGEILITIKAGDDARSAMRKADPGVRAVLASMADAIGASDRTGVRGTVWSNWTARLAQGPVRDYSNAVRNNNDSTGKRAAAEAYLDGLDQRDVQLASLALLRQSLLLLADAHSAAAAGSPADLSGTLELINQQLGETKSLFQRFSAATGGGAGGGGGEGAQHDRKTTGNTPAKRNGNGNGNGGGVGE